MKDVAEYDLTYEMDYDGDLGSLMSFDAHGHLNPEDVELFLATIVEEELFEGTRFGLEVEHLWRTEHPHPDFEGDSRWTYEYHAGAVEGAVVVTRFSIAHAWCAPGTDEPHMCLRHPEEVATRAEPASRFIDDAKGDAIGGYVYYCTPCDKAFLERWQEAYDIELAKDRAARDTASQEVAAL